MNQIYLLSIVYMVFSACLMLLDFHRKKLSFLFRIRALMEEDRRYLNGFLTIGLVIGLLLLFFPVYPGPMFIGDFVPAFTVMAISIYFRILYSDRNKDRTRYYYEGSGKYRKKLGYLVFVIAFLHFAFPSFVLL